MVRPLAVSGILAALLATLVLSSCGGSAAVDERMIDHFGRAGQIQSSLIAGDLEGARRPARWVAEHESLEDPDAEAVQWARSLQQAASDVAHAASLDGAADATGRMVAACAGCHASVGGPRFRTMGAVPSQGTTTGTHMVRHLWAMDRMWEALIGGSDEAWRVGAEALAAQTPDEDFDVGGASAALAEALHEQARAARQLSPAARPAAYADMVKVCAGCHTLNGVGMD
jgi:cytochrome c553